MFDFCSSLVMLLSSSRPVLDKRLLVFSMRLLGMPLKLSLVLLPYCEVRVSPCFLTSPLIGHR